MAEDWLKNIGILILAAGQSRRMGACKALLPLGQASFLGHISKTWRQAGVSRQFVVTGHEAYPVEREAEKLGIFPVRNPVFQQGMFSSILAGLAQIRRETDISWLAIQPVDMPFIPLSVINALLQECCSKTGFPLIVPSMNHKCGHPPFLHHSIFPQVAAWSGEEGLRGFLRTVKARYLNVENDAIFKDIDYPNEYFRQWGNNHAS